ncbi:MAG: hypothetical protein HN742_40485 [Lentisphaerae bacterium]|nr:hypothetical protein [Lentisphaerota bacterium]MBT4822630.1 hypothetical protein [Lentisphaerota bacterium]MBT5610294.1 hypothetical protein [Lentisphaerota bacterium]MBT7056415.1 hypothetical protein [Lentisphaerota bacterium]MBT7848213.1 hypothetical protein [Lentisphaerota bacterium]
MAQQLSVFLENKPGRLEEITATLESSETNIRAMTLATSTAGWGVLNLLVDRPRSAHSALTAAGHSAVLRDIVVIQMDDSPGGLHAVLAHLSAAGINVQNAYGTVLRDEGGAILVIDVEDPEEARGLLEHAGVPLLSEEQVYAL